MFFAAYPMLAAANPIPLTCNHIYSTDGLSNNSVRAVVQDGNGFIWIGTDEGLNRYDGIHFTIYKNDPHDEESLSSNLIMALMIDSKGYLWVATDYGLNRWNPQTNRFTRFMFDEISAEKPGINFILDLYEDSRGRIWIGCVNGLHVYSYETEQFESFFHDPDDLATLSLSHTNDIFEDSRGTMWIATHGKGLNRLNDDGKTFTRIMPDENDLTPSIPWTPTSIFEDSRNRYWVGTWDKGLLRFDPDHLTFDPVLEIQNCNIRFIEEDHFGNLWAGTLGNGLYYYDSGTEQFPVYRHDPTVESSLSSNRVYTFMQDDNDLFWVGVSNGGLNTFRHPQTQIQRYQPSSITESSLSDKSVKAIFEDSQGIVWLGTQEKGLHRYDPQTGEYKNYIYATEANKPHPDTVVVNYVYSLQQLDNGRILVGTLGYGLLVFDPATEEFTFFNDEEHLPYFGYNQTAKDMIRDRQGQFWICNDNGQVICLDSTIQIQRVYGKEPDTFGYDRLTVLAFQDENHLWVGTEAEGLDLLNIETGKIAHYKHDTNDPRSLSNNAIWDILHDRRGRTWIGTNEGLNLYDPETGTFQNVETLQTFPSHTINGIVEDGSDNLWLSINRGLIRFNPQTNEAKWYGLHNGIQGYEFLPKSRYAGAGGNLYFGGPYGFNIIDTKSFKDYPTDSPVVLSDIHVKGKPYIGDRQVWDIETIELPYTQNNLDLHFSLLDSIASSQNQLEYRLGGLPDWQEMNQPPEILFADLSPGVRQLQVRGTNADGSMSPLIKEITIAVLPPFWMTWWFRSIIGLLIVVFGIGIYKLRVRRVAQHNKELQDKVNEQIAQLKILDGLLPICSYCKKVRDDRGYWNQVEAYITKRSQATFSHSICPDCVKEHFPEYAESAGNQSRK